jgi:hypothetical protein
MLNDANKGALDAYSYPEADGVVAGEDWGGFELSFADTGDHRRKGIPKLTR